jgi:UDP-N-acetylglucosamine 2-epimerase (non-hydrolysing)
MTIVGTRPEIIKLSEIIKACDRYFDHVLVHTGQNYDYTLNEVFFGDLGLREPDHYLGVVGEDLGQTIGNVISKSYTILNEIKPDALLILGDTNSTLCAISAKRLKIPIFHMEAGNRCFDENLPEEVNRRIVDHVSDINLTYSEHARRNLLAEGLNIEHVFVVGSPMAEVINNNLEKIKNSEILCDLKLKSKEYILLSAHREENIDIEKNFFSLMNAINSLAETYQVPIIYSMHPRSRKFIEERGFEFHPLVKSLKPFGFSDYISMQNNALCVVSDSGTLAEEASFFTFPAVSIRTSTERPEALDKGNFVIGSITSDSILQTVELAITMASDGQTGTPVPDYIECNTSTKVVKIIQSYTSIVNTMIWRKS